MLYKLTEFLSARLLVMGFCLSPSLISAAPNLMADLNGFDSTPLVDDPWGGVIDGVLTVPPGVQLAVDDNGAVNPTGFSPSIAVGDLNGDGLPDLVIADSKGYFWYFPNSGTPKVPKFTSGEIMPIWIGDPSDPPADTPDLYYVYGNFDANDNTVPRIQLVDFSGEKKLSIVAGNYQGKLFYIHNNGSSSGPSFAMPNEINNITVPTYSGNHLWCNFLAPFLWDFTGNGQLDLLIGEGTYASNSIYRLVNKGSTHAASYNEKFTTKIIPGYGREHLIPQVVDWNNDGKPDIVSGERAGFVDLFLNKSPDNDPAHMQFDDPPPPTPPNHVKFGGQEQLGLFTSIAVADLTNNKLPNLVISNSDNHIAYAENTGKLGSPEFGSPVPIKGVNPLPKVFAAPPGWVQLRTLSMPYVLMVSTKAQDDPTFKPPEDAPNIRSALKIFTVPHKHTYFNNEVYPQNDTHMVTFGEGIPIQAGTHFDLSFWVKTSGNVENLRYLFTNREELGPQGITLPNGDTYRVPNITNTIGAGADWTHFQGDVFLEKADPHKDDLAFLQFFLAFNGNGGSVTITGFTMTKRDQ